MSLLLLRYSGVLALRNPIFAVPQWLSRLNHICGQCFFDTCFCCLPLCFTDLFASHDLSQPRGRAFWGKRRLCTGLSTPSYWQESPWRHWDKELMLHWCDELLSLFLPSEAHPCELSFLMSHAGNYTEVL